MAFVVMENASKDVGTRVWFPGFLCETQIFSFEMLLAQVPHALALDYYHRDYCVRGESEKPFSLHQH